MARARAAAAALALIGYALLSHQMMVRWPEHPWTVAVLFGPLLIGMALAGLRKRHGPSLLGCVLLAGALAALVSHGGVSINLMYVLQHAAIHLLLAATFGWTLLPGHEALITQMARRLHTRFAPTQALYTRRLTAVWAGYFVAMVAVSVAIYLLAPWPVWSFFCNLVTPAAAVVLFVGEFLIRYRLHPEFERLTMQQVVRAYRQQGTAP